MDPLSLSTLQDSLPASSLVNAEKDLLSSFKAAALSITTLYRSSRQTSKRAYNAGYTTACQDLLAMIQQGVSAGESTVSGPAMDVGRVMDWVDARLAAIRAREEEEEEDEEKERERQAPKSKPVPAPSVAPRKRSSPPATARSSSPPVPPLHVPSTSASTVSSRPAQLPTSAATAPRTLKPRMSSVTPLAPSFESPSSPLLSSDPPIFTLPAVPSDTPISVGQKRRHALLTHSDSPTPDGVGIALSAPATPGGTAPGGFVRRRTRGLTRGSGTLTPSSTPNTSRNETPDASMMDVEDEGRERKRVARR